MKNILRVAAMMLLASVCSFGQTLMGQWTFNSSSGPTPAIRIDQGQFAGFQYLQLIFTPQGSSSTCSLTVDTSSNGSSGPFTTGGGVSSQSCLAAGSALSAALGTNVTSIQVNPTLAGGGTVYVQLLGGVAAFGGTGTKPGSPCGDSSHALGWTGSAYNCQGITGSASAGGSNLQIQWNNSTALGGISGFTTNGTTTVNGGASSVFDMHLGTSVFLPGALSTGILKVTTSTGALSDAAGSDVASLLSASLPLTLSGSGVFACAGCGQTGNPLSQFASTTSAQLRGIISDANGTGTLVFGTNAVLATPNLGTPSVIVLTNATGLPNAGLLNPATTVNGQSCTLGSTCTIPFSTNSSGNTSQAGINLLTSTTNLVGLTLTPINSATNQEKFEITGGSYTGNAATATNISTSGTANQVWGMNSGGSAQGWQNQSGGVSSITVNGGSALSGTANFQNGSAVDGITINASNPSGSNVAFAISGSLTNAGLANSSITTTCTSPLNCGASVSLGSTNTFNFITTPLSGQTLTATNGSQPAFTSSSFKDSTNSPVSLASAAYVPACDSSTTIVDRGTNIVFITSNTNPINLPLSSASGCSGMYFRGQNLTGGSITINKNTTDTLTVTGGTGTQGTGQTSATIANDTYFSANQSSSGVWEIASGGTGTGTVTHSTGSLLANASVIGNTGADLQTTAGGILYLGPIAANTDACGPLNTLLLAAQTAGVNTPIISFEGVATNVKCTSDPFAGYTGTGGAEIRLGGVQLTTDVPIGLPYRVSMRGASAAGASVQASTTYHTNYPTVVGNATTDTICPVNGSTTVVAGTWNGTVCVAGGTANFSAILKGYMLLMSITGTAATPGNTYPVGIVQSVQSSTSLTLQTVAAGSITAPASSHGFQFAFVAPVVYNSFQNQTGGLFTTNYQQFEHIGIGVNDSTSGVSDCHFGYLNVYGQEGTWAKDVKITDACWAALAAFEPGENHGPDEGIYVLSTKAFSTSIGTVDVISRVSTWHGLRNSTINVRNVNAETAVTGLLVANGYSTHAGALPNYGAAHFDNNHIEVAGTGDAIQIGDAIGWPWAGSGQGLTAAVFTNNTGSPSNAGNLYHIMNATGGTGSYNVIIEGSGTEDVNAQSNCIKDDVNSVSYLSCPPRWVGPATVEPDVLDGALDVTGQILATEPTGSVWGSATGGAEGAGTINAAGLFVNGVAVGASGANTALSNLVSPSINTTLLFQTATSLGSATHPPQNLFLSGTGTYGSASIELTGVPGANRTATFPDNSGIVAELNASQNWTASQILGGHLITGESTKTSSYTGNSTADSGNLIVMNCSSACTYTFNATPGNGYYGAVMSIGSTVATVSLNSLDFNGSTSVPVLNSYRPIYFWSDGANFFGETPLVAGSNITLTPAANGLTVAASGGGSWSALTNPTGNLSLTMGSDTSTFNTTTAVSNFFQWANTTAATSGTAQSSPLLSLCGQGWEGGTPANVTDCWDFQQSIGNGSNPTVNLAITDTGTSTGTMELSFPGQINLGSGPPTCAGGTAGGLCSNEGTDFTAASGVDQIMADATLHDYKVQSNGGVGKLLGSSIGYNSGSVSATIASTNVATSANFPTGQYVLSCDVAVTAVGSSPTLAVTIGWTDITGTARTKTCTTGVVTISDNPVTQTITSNGSAAITVTQTLAASTATWWTTVAITRLQ